MKRIITLVLFSLLLVSCSNDESDSNTPEQTSIANKSTEKRILVINDNTLATISDTGFVEIKSEFYSNKSEDCGKILSGGSESSDKGTLNDVKIQRTTFIRYIVKCE